MKRFHVHVSVSDLPKSVGFYSKLFGAEPSVVKPDYAKWMLEDPRVNFAISQRGQAPGLNHFGFQVDSEAELQVLRDQVALADIAAVEQSGAACCYAKSDKYWVEDPQGIAWETFHTLGGIPVFGEEAPAAVPNDTACCVPMVQQPQQAQSACCTPARPATAVPASPQTPCC